MTVQDEGVYQYINEESTAVKRYTQLSSDVVLSATQNDEIHSGALKTIQASKFTHDSDKAVTLHGTSSSSSGARLSAADALDTADQQMEGEEMSSDDEDDECAVLDPQPLAGLFSRLAKGDKKRAAVSSDGPAKRPKTAVGNVPTSAVTAGVPNPKAKAKAKGKSTRNRSGEADGGNGNAPGELDDLLEVEPKGDFASEDAALLSSYVAQTKDLMKLDVSKSDDQTFTPWFKDRTAKLNELKGGINTKKSHWVAAKVIVPALSTRWMKSSNVSMTHLALSSVFRTLPLRGESFTMTWSTALTKIVPMTQVLRRGNGAFAQWLWRTGIHAVTITLHKVFCH